MQWHHVRSVRALGDRCPLDVTGCGEQGLPAAHQGKPADGHPCPVPPFRSISVSGEEDQDHRPALGSPDGFVA